MPNVISGMSITGPVRRRMWLAGGVLALLTLVSAATFFALLNDRSNMLEVVNIAGRQRMLSQRAVYFATRIGQTSDAVQRAAAVNRLNTTVAQMAASHQRFLGMAMSPEVRDLYLGDEGAVAPMLDNYLARLRQIATRGTDHIPAAADVEAVQAIGLGPMLASLERVVAAFQADGERQAQRLLVIQVVALVGTVLVIGAVFLWLFMPLARRIERQMAENAAISADLVGARQYLEDEVSRRTRDLEAVRAEAVAARQLKSEVLAAVGHDLQQPVEALGLMLSSAQARLTDAPERAAAVLVDMQGVVASMNGLIDGMAAVAQVENGIVSAQRRPMPLGPILDQMKAEFGLVAERAGLAFTVWPAAFMVESDPLMLQRILRNLLANAFRYTTDGSVTVRPETLPDRMVRISVVDTGCGFPEEDRDRLFRAFTRGVDDDAPAAMGLGLSICDRLCRRLGHGLGVSSGPGGKGSMFWIDLPLVGQSTAPAAGSSSLW